MKWTKTYAGGVFKSWQDEKGNHLFVVHRIKWDVDLNNHTIKSWDTPEQAMTFAVNYMNDNPIADTKAIAEKKPEKKPESKGTKEVKRNDSLW